MKKILLLLTLAFVACVNTLSAKDKDNDINFVELTYDFGTVSANHEPVTHEYEFTNATDEPLTILSVSASCGCTRPKYNPEPLKPGKKGKITVSFLPAGQRGYISKNVKVRYKVAGKKTKTVTLKITGNVTPE